MKQKVLDFVNLFTGLRKTIIMLLLIVICVVFRSTQLISGENLVDLLKATVISYFGSNSVEYFTGMVKEHLISKNNMANVEDDVAIVASNSK